MTDKALENATEQFRSLSHRIELLSQEMKDLLDARERVDKFIKDWHTYAGIAPSSYSKGGPPSPVRPAPAVLWRPATRPPAPMPAPPPLPMRPRPLRNSKREEVARAARNLIGLFGTPLSRKDLYNLLLTEGLTIHGADPDMVLSTMLWRSRDSIVRLPKFGYWLADEPYEPAGYVPGHEPESDEETEGMKGAELLGALPPDEQDEMRVEVNNGADGGGLFGDDTP